VDETNSGLLEKFSGGRLVLDKPQKVQDTQMFLTHAAQVVYDAVLTLAYPQVCTICARSVEQRKFGVACEVCWNKARIFSGTETICWKCGVVSPGEVTPELREEVRCRSCDSHLFAVARAVGLYEGALRESVLLLKRQPYLSQHLETLLVSTAMRDPLNTSTRIIPVPLHAKRFKARGFNQAAIIAQALSKSLRLPLDEVSLVRPSAAEKYRAGLDRKGRHDTVTGAFEVVHPRLVENEDILLVDDVFTTGATVSACAEALVAAGASNVFVLTVARACS
jgi:ComF family protein